MNVTFIFDSWPEVRLQINENVAVNASCVAFQLFANMSAISTSNLVLPRYNINVEHVYKTTKL